MKTLLFAGALITANILLSARPAEAAGAQPGAGLPASVSWIEGTRGPNSSLWFKVAATTNEMTRQLELQTNFAYVELTTGLHYRDENGRWLTSQDVIEPFSGGAIARQGPHRVTFAGNLNTAGAIDMRMPDGQRLRSHVLGLDYFDAASGKSVLFATVQDSLGSIVAANQVLYSNAFTGCQADVRYTYTKSSLEQDIILRGQLPAPAAYGLNPDSTRLEVLTEFLSPPEPTPIRHAPAGALGDEQLEFATMRIGQGYAFSMGDDARSHSRTPVTKSWLRQDSRRVLVEGVSVSELQKSLQFLPSLPLAKRDLPGRNATASRSLPAAPPAYDGTAGEMKLAMGQPPNGVVVDYITINSELSNYTFTNGTTYYVSGTVQLDGTTTIQGGTVIKFANDPSASLNVSGVNCQATAYRPAIFTSINDNSVGDTISGSTGRPSPPFYPTGLFVQGTTYNLTLHDMRFNYLNEGIYFQPQYGSTLTLRDSQICNCGTGVEFYGLTPVNFYAGNVLFAYLSTGVYTPRIVNATLDYVTADNINLLAESDETQWGSLTLNNSILANVATVGNDGLPISGQGNNGTYGSTPALPMGSIPATSNPFQSIGPAAHYLLPYGPFSAVGTPSSDPVTLADLRHKTTAAPILLTNTITSATNLLPRPPVNLDSPDLGYHYTVLDYLVATTTVANATISLNAGVVVGMLGTKGIVLNTGAVLDSEGTPTALNRFENYRGIMEAPASATQLPQNSLGASISIPPGTFTTAPVITCHYTGFETPAGAYRHVAGGGAGNLNFTDCQFSAGIFNGQPSPLGTQETIAATNCLWEQVTLELVHYPLPKSAYFYNNLFRNGTLTLLPPTANSYHFYDNLIDSVAISQSGQALDAGYNAYITGQQRLSPAGSGDQVIAATDYQAGPLGIYYYPTSGNGLNTLVNQGSRSAAAAGLSDHTTVISQAPEGTSTVDIGFHYMAYGNGSSSGVDFWLAVPFDFPDQNNGTPQFTVVISSPVSTKGAVLISGLSDIYTFSLNADQTTNIVIDSAALLTAYDTPLKLGIHVIAQNPVSASLLDYDIGQSESYLCHSTPMLGTNYCLMSRQSDYGFDLLAFSKFAVIATADNTVVTIIPSPIADLAHSFGGYPIDTNPFSFTLHQGQVYQLESYFVESDVTGTLIESTAPIAVVAGDNLAELPVPSGHANPLFEQQLPVNEWGSWALAMPLAGRHYGDVYRVLAAYSNTVVTLNGQLLGALQPGQFFEQVVTGAVMFQASQPIQVAQFSIAADFGGNPGDPFETLTLSPEQYSPSCIFSIPANFTANYANIIVPQSALANTYLDGSLVSSLATFTPIGASGYSGAQVGVAAGTHFVTSSQPAGVQVYGLAFLDGYGNNAIISTPVLAAAPDYVGDSLNSSVTINVLTNDAYSSLTDLTVSIVGSPTLGSASVNADKTITYISRSTPGTDQFTYQITENGLVSTAQVTVWINNRAPTAQNVFVCQDVTSGPIQISLVGHASDPDGDPVRVLAVGTAIGSSFEPGGFATANPDGQSLTYLAGIGVNDAFSYTVADSKGATATAIVYINPVVAAPFFPGVFARAGTSTQIDLTTLDQDLAGLPYAVISVSQGADGSVTFQPGTPIITYTPYDPSFTGQDTFTYTISDGFCTDTGGLTMFVQ